MLAAWYVRHWVACLNLAYVLHWFQINWILCANIQGTTDTADMAFCSSFDNDISSAAIEQSSAEDVLALVWWFAYVSVLANDCTSYKCCIIYSLTSFEKIKKFVNTEAENTEK
jgi:hypothetical protein